MNWLVTLTVFRGTAALVRTVTVVVTASLLISQATNAAVPAKPDESGESSPAAGANGERMPETVINKVPDDVPTHTINIEGRAKNATGEPIAGATIYVTSHNAFHKLLKTTTTNKNGEYAFRDLALPMELPDGGRSFSAGRFEVYGTAKNYAFAWRSQKAYYPDLRGNTIMGSKSPDGPTHFVGDEKIKLDLTFVRPAPLSGTIVDEKGNPVPDTKVHLFNCWKAPNEKFSDLDMAQFDMSSLYSSNYCPPEVSTVKTNVKGEFRFKNAPPECRYRISVKPPGFAGRMMYATTEATPSAEKDERRTFFAKGTKLERDGMQLMFESPRELQIKLVGLAKPEHGDGAHVNPHNRQAGASGVSNENGVATMKIPPGEYTVSILPPIDTPYWKTDRKITVTKEPKQSFELKMTPAAVVEVQVVDEDGNPVPAEGFDLWVDKEYEQKDGSFSRQRDIHSFRNYDRKTRIFHVHRVRTDKSGWMRANFLPGNYLIGIGKDSKPKGWTVIDTIGFEVDLEAGKTEKVTLAVTRDK